MQKFKRVLSSIKHILNFAFNCFISTYHFKSIRVYLCNHLTVDLKYLKIKNVQFPHPIGIVIGSNVKFGNNCTIYQNVTIGTKHSLTASLVKYPSIEENVTIYANSVIVGNITIGRNSIVGAGSVVLSDVPPNSVVAGNPARVIKIIAEE